jgi:hypothetical protein
MNPLPITILVMVLSALVFWSGWFAHSSFGGRWVRPARDPRRPNLDPTHFCVRLRGLKHRFTVEQLTVARKREN